MGNARFGVVWLIWQRFGKAMEQGHPARSEFFLHIPNRDVKCKMLVKCKWDTNW